MTTSTLAPGCNLPCIPYSPENPDLWWQSIEATDKGLISALCDEDERRSSDRFQHLVLFPTWSKGAIGFLRLQPGQKVRVEAANEHTLRVIGDGFEAEYPDSILVIFHGSLDREAVKSYYSQEG